MLWVDPTDSIVPEEGPAVKSPPVYRPRYSRALRRGALETLMNPSSGRFISRTRKIAADIEHAQMNKMITDMAWRERTTRADKQEGEPAHEHNQESTGQFILPFFDQHPAGLRDLSRGCGKERRDCFRQSPPLPVSL